MHKGWIFAPALLALGATGCSQQTPEGVAKAVTEGVAAWYEPFQK